MRIVRFSRFAALFALLSLCAACLDAGPSDSLRRGEAPPAFELVDMEGVKHCSNDLKDGVTLLNFWATWCPPCVAEMPSLERLHRELRNDGLRVVTINVDNERDVVEKFARDNALTLPILLDPNGATARQFGTTAFPETFFLDRDGKLVEFFDPQIGRETVRVISDRTWDSPMYIASIRRLLPKRE
jgi:thiol-disulfide isomerase/thioredoxin